MHRKSLQIRKVMPIHENFISGFFFLMASSHHCFDFKKSDCMLYKVQEKISLQLTTCDDDNLL